MQRQDLAKTASKYESVGNWFAAARQRGYSVPVQLCQGLDECMSALGLSFPQAFALLVKHDKIILVDKSYIYDLSAQQLWQKKPLRRRPKADKKRKLK
jgi:hypothetical protein